jgi:hypothetical protein
MKDWFVAFIAAASLVGLVLWCVYIFIGVIYG